MSERQSAGKLLIRAGKIFDAPDNPLAAGAAAALRRGFASGGEWMQLALVAIRQQSTQQALPPSTANLQLLGFVKYALACAAAMACVLAGLALRRPSVGLLGVPAFYAVEAQMVFLFPLALDGSVRPFRESRRWTGRAGGTLAVMRVVLPLAATMLFGGFAGRGLVRSWCLGCLAVCIWYEDLRTAARAAVVNDLLVGDDAESVLSGKHRFTPGTSDSEAPDPGARV